MGGSSCVGPTDQLYCYALVIAELLHKCKKHVKNIKVHNLVDHKLVNFIFSL